ncbi:hypothetical protein [Psychrobacter urativorans]|uniref:Uncharacterized protein n=1 Tax=Psychrobacter urativorans TaxID=45610 RepID=A0A0M5MJR7_9GAMM|nr:hypothetical protein [Psychrobacter urativorans]ALF60168.1 hypothetical protein AOC03_09070 [Psychrobacter urativorans]
MGIIKIIQSSIDHELEKKYTSIRQTAARLKKAARPCVCGGIAPPIKTKIYTYRCIRCDKRFTNVSDDSGRRNLNDFLNASFKEFNHLLDMDYYDEAIELLKQRANVSDSIN